MFDQATWEFINTFAPWLSALGTIAAVVVSLYLARRDNRIRMEIQAGIRFQVDIYPGAPVPTAEEAMTVCITVTNLGRRVATVNSIGLKMKLGRHVRQGIIKPPVTDPYSDTLPKKLGDGEEAHLFFETDFLNELVDNHVEDWLQEMWWLPRALWPFALNFVRFNAGTTTGEVFSAPPEKNMREYIKGRLGLTEPTWPESQRELE